MLQSSNISQFLYNYDVSGMRKELMKQPRIKLRIDRRIKSSIESRRKLASDSWSDIGEMTDEAKIIINELTDYITAQLYGENNVPSDDSEVQQLVQTIIDEIDSTPQSSGLEQFLNRGKKKSRQDIVSFLHLKLWQLLKGTPIVLRSRPTLEEIKQLLMNVDAIGEL